jgi:lysophospholipase L1-like esterase
MRQVITLHCRGKAGLFGLLLAAALLLAACRQSVSPTPRRILFIGDSTTYWNQGVNAHLAAMAASDDPPLKLETDSVTKGGTSLAKLWEDTNAVETIRNGHWDIVVLQDDLIKGSRDAWPQQREDFLVAVRKFDQEIRQTGAKTALFMPWVYTIYTIKNVTIPMEDLEDSAKAYREIGKELGAKVIPVGLAWQQVTFQQPTLNLYDTDGGHPNIKGTFLDTCMHYIALFGASVHCAQYQPESLIPSPDTISSKALARDMELLRETFVIPAEERAFLEKIAHETVAAQAETTPR